MMLTASIDDNDASTGDNAAKDDKAAFDDGNAEKNDDNAANDVIIVSSVNTPYNDRQLYQQLQK